MIKIQCNTTPEDIADAYLRMPDIAKLSKQARWRNTLWITIFSGTILFMFATLLGATIVERLIISMLCIMTSVGLYWFTYRRTHRRNIIHLLRKNSQSSSPIPFTIELRDDCIWTKQGPAQISYDWRDVAEIVDKADAIEFRIRDGGLIVVRNDGFNTSDIREEFKRFANGMGTPLSGRPPHTTDRTDRVISGSAATDRRSPAGAHLPSE